MATSATAIWSVPYVDVWRALRARWKVDIAESVRRPYDDVEQAQLWRCNACALQYFSPLLPGSSEFYAAISSNPDYYVSDRWEFRQVLSSIQPGDSLIDFGSGRGAFLAQSKNVAGRIVGCDHNTALLVDGGSDTEIEHEGFAELAARYAGQFDVATAFHVLEHVASAEGICGPARTALRPGGRLFLSTPDALRTVRDEFEVLDCPPHHLSRWTDAQYAKLGELHGFELIAIRHEPFVHRFGARTLIPRPVLYALALARHRLSGRHVQAPHGLHIGLADSDWPRGLAVFAEYRRL